MRMPWCKASIENNPPFKNPCVNCKHFLKPKVDAVPLKYGSCKKFTITNPVDGITDYKSASVAREYDCKGALFEDMYNYNFQNVNSQNVTVNHTNNNINNNTGNHLYDGDSRRIF